MKKLILTFLLIAGLSACHLNLNIGLESGLKTDYSTFNEEFGIVTAPMFTYATEECLTNNGLDFIQSNTAVYSLLFRDLKPVIATHPLRHRTSATESIFSFQCLNGAKFDSVRIYQRTQKGPVSKEKITDNELYKLMI